MDLANTLQSNVDFIRNILGIKSMILVILEPDELQEHQLSMIFKKQIQLSKAILWVTMDMGVILIILLTYRGSWTECRFKRATKNEKEVPESWNPLTFNHNMWSDLLDYCIPMN